MDIQQFRHQLHNIRWNEFKQFIDQDECHLGDYACWNGIRYIQYLANKDDVYSNELLDISEMYDWQGIYIISQSNSYEEHFFCIDINDDNLTVYQTYGGVECFQKLDFDTNTWLSYYDEIFNGDLRAYNFCFNLNVITSKSIVPDEVRYEKLF